MDTKVIVTRLQKLENYARHLSQLQQAPLSEYLFTDPSTLGRK